MKAIVTESIRRDALEVIKSECFERWLKLETFNSTAINKLYAIHC